MAVRNGKNGMYKLVNDTLYDCSNKSIDREVNVTTYMSHQNSHSALCHCRWRHCNPDHQCKHYVNRVLSGPREYAASDPRYIVEPVMVAKRSCKTRNLVCNQLRSKCRSNPAINLITLECLGIPKPLGIVDLSTSTNLSIIE
jgi:hypothetical protein